MSPTTSPLDVVVRFSTSNPDLLLNISNPQKTSNITLRQLIRSHLEPPASEARLRLIHSGRDLSDNAALGKSVNVTRPPPGDDDGKSSKAKGKLPVRDPAARVYIHCSVGDALSSAELAAETKAAEEADTALESETTQPEDTKDVVSGQENASTTTPAPRGFDRLLSAGFTAAEVASLRAQFLAIQAHTHTPDTMPTGPDLLALEERWLDNGSGGAGGGEGDTGGFGPEDTGGLDDILWGTLLGFFWPIGSMCFLMREEGIWSRRRQIAALSGFLVNLTFGFLRVMN